MSDQGSGKPAWRPRNKMNWEPGYDSPENVGVPQDPKPKVKDPGPRPNNDYVGDGRHRVRRRYDPELRKEYNRKRLGNTLLWLAVLFIIGSLIALDGRGCGSLVGGGLGVYWTLMAIAAIAGLLIKIILSLF